MGSVAASFNLLLIAGAEIGTLDEVGVAVDKVICFWVCGWDILSAAPASGTKCPSLSPSVKMGISLSSTSYV